MGNALLDDITGAPLDHIIIWNLSNDDTAEMPAPKITVHWVGACANDHTLISCTIDEQLLSYQDPWVRDPGGRTRTITVCKQGMTVFSKTSYTESQQAFLATHTRGRH